MHDIVAPVPPHSSLVYYIPGYYIQPGLDLGNAPHPGLDLDLVTELHLDLDLVRGPGLGPSPMELHS